MTPNPGGRVLSMALLPLLLLLGGCVRLDTDIVISSRDTVDMSMLIAIQDDYAAAVDTFCEQDGAGGTVSTYDEGGYVGCLREVTGAPLSALSDDNLDLSIVHADGEYRFAMVSTELGVSAGGDEQLIASLFTDFRVSVTFPGQVTAHNGSSTVDGTTVTWTDASDMASGEGLRATADESGSVLTLLPWLGAALLVAAGVVVGLLLLNRSKGTPASGAPQWSPPPGAGFPPPPGSGFPPPPGSGFPPPSGAGYPSAARPPSPGAGYVPGAGHPPAGGGYPGVSGQAGAPPASGYPPPSGGFPPPPSPKPRVGDYADPSYLDSPPPEDKPPRSPWAPPG